MNPVSPGYKGSSPSGMTAASPAGALRAHTGQPLANHFHLLFLSHCQFALGESSRKTAREPSGSGAVLAAADILSMLMAGLPEQLASDRQ